MTHISKAETQTGVMVALFPSPATAGMLAQPGGELPQDLHVTLAFLGDAMEVDDPTGLKATVELFARTCGPIAGEISGVGHFTAGPEPVSYASVDLPGLEEVRDRLVDALEAGGYPPSTLHGFTPHMTLAYDDRCPDLPNLPLVFDTITVAVAGERTSYPLTGAEVRKDAMYPIEVGDPVRESHGDLSLGRSGVIMAESVRPADGAWVYDVRWEDGTTSEAVDEPSLRSVRDLTKAAGGSVSNTAWDGSPSRFTDAQWEKSCLLDRGVTAGTVKQRYALPVREPSRAINRRALASAAARLSTVKAHPEQVKAARAELQRLYVQSGLKVPASMNITKADTSWDVPIWKAQDTPERIVYGVVLHPGVTDSQGDVVSAQEIEQAAHRFLVESRKHDVQHAESVVPVETVESYIAPADLEVAGRPVLKGSWVMATRINDDTIWQSVMKDEITGYSIGGSAVRSES